MLLRERVTIPGHYQELERAIQIQREESERSFRKADSILRLEVASLAGAIAVVGLLANASLTIGIAAFVGFCAAIGLLMGGLVLVVSNHVGFPWPVDVRTGADVAKLTSRLFDPEWDLPSFHASLVFERSAEIKANLRMEQAMNRRITQGFVLSMVGGLLFVLVLVFILGGTIHGLG